MTKVYPDKCIGCGACASICPESFKMTDDMKAEFTGKKGSCIQEAIDSCPVDAIN